MTGRVPLDKARTREVPPRLRADYAAVCGKFTLELRGGTAERTLNCRRVDSSIDHADLPPIQGRERTVEACFATVKKGWYREQSSLVTNCFF